MPSLHLFIILFAVYNAYAWPSPHSSKRSVHEAALTSRHKNTHRKRGVDSPGGIVETFHPAASFDTFGDGFQLDLPDNAARDGSALVKVVTGFLHSHLKLAGGTFESTHHTEGEVVNNIYFKQMINGIPVVNARANVAISKANKIVSSASNYREPSSVSAPVPALTAEEAFAAAESHLGGKRVDHPAELKYYLNDAHSAILVHVVQVQTPDRQHWYQAYVDATTGEVVGLVDFVSHAAYHALPISKKDPTQGLETISNPQDLNASPKGWHSDNNDTNIRTTGNNAMVYMGDESNTQASSGPGNQFTFQFDESRGLQDPGNIATAKVNAFYITNIMHDVAYVYGFDEMHFNFQADNFGKGGAGGDPVKVSIHDDSGQDNANFATPSDGQSGLMRMYVWDKTNPGHDGALENDLVSHEYTHGITNRLTGGGTADCLQSEEGGGMGEGWSDAMAFWVQQTDSSVKDFTLGAYVNGTPIRSRPYSQSKDVNALTYRNAGILHDPHEMGEIWANVLINIYWELVTQNGFSAMAHTDGSGTAGNVVWLHIFMDALQLQPCEPTFLTGRDSWIQADRNRYGGAHSCLLWKMFASRGLGLKASNYTDDSTIPGGVNCDAGR